MLSKTCKINTVYVGSLIYTTRYQAYLPSMSMLCATRQQYSRKYILETVEDLFFI